MKSDEIFDVVNENDEVIGQEKRSIVHAQGLHHRAVHILIENQKGELLLQKRSPFKDMNPNVWVTSCSGHVDAGENYDFAAQRELSEELGIQEPIQLKRLFKLTTCEETGWEFVWVYQGFHEGPFSFNPQEITEGQFFDKNKITEWIQNKPEDFAPSFLYLWKKIYERDAQTP